MMYDMDFLEIKIHEFIERELAHLTPENNLEITQRKNEVFDVEYNTFNKQPNEYIEYTFYMYPQVVRVSKTVAIANPSGSRQYLAFTSSELKFFDMLGWEISVGQRKSTGQQIEDWIYDESIQ